MGGLPFALSALCPLLLLTTSSAGGGDTAVVDVDVVKPRFSVDALAFLCMNIDSASLTNGIDLTDAYLRTLALQLSLAGGASGEAMHLRIGGSASNSLYYVPEGEPGRGAHGSTCVTDASLAALNDFAVAARLRITFCLPYQTGGSGKAWDPSINASALWASARAHNWTALQGWSLGNELIGAAGFDVAAYAADYSVFRATVSAQAPAWAQDIVGPSAAGFPGAGVIDPFLDATAPLPGMSLSMHAYSFKNCTLEAYLARAGMDRMADYYSAFAAARDAHAPSMPLYLEEMATQAGGGCEGLSNRFVSSFWFLRALGLAGEAGVARVTRQDFVGWSFTSGASHYTLAGPPGWSSTASGGLPTPHPDYFSAILWRQLVGGAVLSLTLATSPPAVNDTLALHAWCARGSAGALVLVVINTSPAAVALSLAGGLAPTPRVDFFLTAPGGNLTADAVLLNGEPLVVDARGRLPAQPLPGRSVAAGGGSIDVPAYACGFILLPAAAAAACA